MKIPEPSSFIEHFCHYAPAVMAENFGPRRCLNATRICLEVMHELGVRAEPLSVEAMAVNKEYFERFQKNGGFPQGGQLDEWIAAGAWGVGIDTFSPSDPGDWAGHVVAIVQKNWLVDASSIQFERPQHKIRVPHVFFGFVTARFLKGKGPLIYRLNQDGKIIYQARPEDRSFVRLDGFQRSEWNLEAAREIVKRMRCRTPGR